VPGGTVLGMLLPPASSPVPERSEVVVQTRRGFGRPCGRSPRRGGKMVCLHGAYLDPSALYAHWLFLVYHPIKSYSGASIDDGLQHGSIRSAPISGHGPEGPRRCDPFRCQHGRVSATRHPEQCEKNLGRSDTHQRGVRSLHDRVPNTRHSGRSDESPGEAAVHRTGCSCGEMRLSLWRRALRLGNLRLRSE
jgi:hypothetical protein